MLADLVQIRMKKQPHLTCKVNRAAGSSTGSRGANMWDHKILQQDQMTSLWGAGGWPRVSYVVGPGQVGTSCEK